MLDLTLQQLTDALAAPRPLPAGGAAVVAAGTAGAALGLKVVRISAKRADTGSAPTLREAADRLARVGVALPPCYAADCAAFESVLAARRIQPPDRNALATAWIEATAVPVRVLELARDGLGALQSVRDAVRPAVRCDLVAAATLLWTAADVSCLNALANARSLPGEGAALERAARAAHAGAEAAYRSIRDWGALPRI